MFRLLADEDFKGHYTRGLRMHVSGIDLVRVQDVGLRSRPDPVVLEWAAGDDRIVLTHDRATMRKHAEDRIAAGMPTPGVFIVHSGAAVAAVVESIELIVAATQHGEWVDRVEFLPY